MHKRSYYSLLTTITLSSFGDTFGLLAMEWMVYEITGSKLAMGALALSSTIPELLLRLLGSPLSDRLHRGRLMASLAAVRLLALALPLAMGLAGQLQLWHLFVAAGLSGACSALFMPTAMAVLPGIAGEERLMRAFAVIDGCRNAAALLGPALAGTLIAATGALPAMGINAVCYTAAILTLLYLPNQDRPAKSSSAAFSITAYIGEIGDGLSFYKQFPAMLLIMGMAAVSNMSSFAIWTLMVPYVNEVLHRDAAAMGTLSSAFALGTLAGLGIVSWVGEIKQRTPVMLGTLAATSLSVSFLGLTDSYPLVLTALFLSGITTPFFSSLSSSLHGRLVPNHLQGRVNSIRFLLSSSLLPVGALAGGAIAQHYGVRILVLSAGLMPALYCTAAWFVPNLRMLNGDLSALKAEVRRKLPPGPAAPTGDIPA
ncbi:MFS transporter [Paenibacillus donghaensis]|uniref:Major facilitator superfamily (MFS) profile domain-containing protein n=1 Tax=Paenibacillus donghaensis TaxID=414771 RepID=A0A2Z2KF00_9BACL|nr:MFS transporter [Paenibacillus donghaensis]ASA25376.1 hypothetical protein B9T62_34370 [Paenibacillus donghaensis]